MIRLPAMRIFGMNSNRQLIEVTWIYGTNKTGPVAPGA